MNAQRQALVVEPDDGRVVHHPSGAVITVKVHAADTDGTYSLLESVLPEGGVVPPHIHHHEDEAAYVLEGELTITVADSTVRAPAGSYVVMPRDTAQSMTNSGDGPCRFLTVYTPGGAESYFEQAEELAQASHGAPPPAEMAVLHERFALEYL